MQYIKKRQKDATYNGVDRKDGTYDRIYNFSFLE